MISPYSSRVRNLGTPGGGTLILAFLLFTVQPISGYQTMQREEAISEERLIALLIQRVAFPKIIEAINDRGVSFQSFQPFIDEIKEAGKYLGSGQLNQLLTVASNNYRPPKTPVYRISYMSLQGVAANLLLDKTIDKGWNKVLGNKDYSVAQNQVLITLSRLMTRFSSRNYGQQYFSSESSEMSPDDEAKLARLYRIRRKPLFVGSTGEPTGDGDPAAGVATDSAARFIHSLNDQSKQWRVVDISEDPAPRRKGRFPIDLYTFRKFLEPNELPLFAPAKLAAFYAYITKSYLPADFAVVELAANRTIEAYQSDELCGEVPDKYGPIFVDANLLGPLLRLNVAVIENVSQEPITTGRLFVKVNNAEPLRTREQDRAALDSALFQPIPLFTSGVLKPGEKIVIPIDLSLTNEAWDDWDTPAESADDPQDFADELDRLRKAGGLRFPGFRSRLSISANWVEAMLRRPPIDYSKTPEYLYGPSLRIEAVEINRGGDLVRYFDPTKLNISPEGERSGGSCPYIYAYDAASASWVNQGTILFGNSAKAKESMDETQLRGFDGRLLIKERDPEESFIDLVQIRATLPDGSSIILRAKDPRLRDADGNYLQLRQGEQIEVGFEIPEGFVAEKYSVVSFGYYVPYNKTASPASHRRTMASRQRFARQVHAWR